MDKKGDMGIGTLILFIAFILVAAVAAGVLISTTNALQSKALTTGKATTSEVGTSMVSVEVYSEDATAYINGTAQNDSTVDFFFWTVKLSSGSDEVKFSDLLLTMNTKNQSSEYSYGTNFTYASNYGSGAVNRTQTVNCSNSLTFAKYNSTSNVTNTDPQDWQRTTFGAQYSLQASSSISGYMVSGDVVKLCFVSPRAIGENEDVTLNLIPKVGSALTVDTTMPALMINKRIYVFP